MGGFRKTLISWGGKIMLVLLILSFGLWGITDYVSPQANVESIASVGGVEITSRDLQREVQRQIDNFRRNSGINLDRDQAKAMGLINNSVENLIQRQLISLTADDLGLLVDENTLRAQVHGDKNFQGPGGRFDRGRFDQAMRQLGLHESTYFEFLRYDLLSRQFLSNLEALPGAPRTLVDAVYRHRAEKRVAQILRFDHDKIKALAEPKDVELRAFHQKNAARFMAPEYRAVTLVRIKPEAMIDRVKVAEKKLREEYNNRLDEFSAPERRTLQQILLGDEAKAKKASDRLNGGEDFLKVAKEEAKMAPADAKIGTFDIDGVPLLSVGKAAFSLSEGAVSGPIKSDLGWHIVKVKKIIPPSTVSFAEARSKLRQEIAGEKALDLLYEMSNKLEDALGGGANLDEAARRLNLPVTRLAAVSPSGLDKTDKQVLDGKKDQKIIKTAFETPKGSESTLGEAGEADIFTLRVDDVIKPALLPFGGIRKRVVDTWSREQRINATRDLAKKAMDMVKAGRTWEDVAKAHNGLIETSAPFTRAGQGLKKPLPASIISDLFKNAQGITAQGSNAQAQFIARVSKIVPAQPAAEKKGMDALKRELSQSISNDLTTQLVMGLRLRHGVTLNRPAIDQVY